MSYNETFYALIVDKTANTFHHCTIEHSYIVIARTLALLPERDDQAIDEWLELFTWEQGLVLNAIIRYADVNILSDLLIHGKIIISTDEDVDFCIGISINLTKLAYFDLMTDNYNMKGSSPHSLHR